MVGEAVNVTLVPEQMLVEVAETETDGTTVELTAIATGADVAVAGDAQVAVDVITQAITSPLFSAALVYVALFGPTLDPLSNH